MIRCAEIGNIDSSALCSDRVVLAVRAPFSMRCGVFRRQVSVRSALTRKKGSKKRLVGIKFGREIRTS